MAYKCKTCGYVFKKSDSDLCPECFTARDDIDCFSFGEQHNHFKDTSDEKDSFIAEQLRQETSATPEELGEKFRDMTDSFKRSFSQDTPPNTYQKASTPPPAQPQNKVPDLGSYKTSNSSANYTQYRTGSRYFTSADQMHRSDGSRPAVKLPKLFAVVFVLMFLMPFLITSIVTISNLKNTVKDKMDKSNAAEFGDISLPDMSEEEEPLLTDENDGTLHFASQDPLDEEIYLTISNIECADTFNNPEDTRSIAEFFGYQMSEETLQKEFKLLFCTVTLDTEGYLINNADFMSTDSENAVYCESKEAYSDTYIDQFPLLVTEDFGEYLLVLDTINEDGSEEERHVFNCYLDFSQLMTLAGVEGYSYDAENENGADGASFDYNYGREPFPTSLKDADGRNVQLKFTGNSAEMVKTSPENELITLFDNSLSDDTWGLYEVKLVYADQSHADINCRCKSVSLLGYDTNGICVYTFREELSGDLPELPMAKLVQYYSCTIEYAEPDGSIVQAVFDITASELYNS